MHEERQDLLLHSNSTDTTGLHEDEWLVLSIKRIYTVKTRSNAVKVAGVIRREFDNLTKEEIVQHAIQVSQAKFEELKR